MNKDEQKTYSRKVAAFIYASAVLTQDDANCVIWGDEIDEQFEGLPKSWKLDKDFIDAIIQELNNYDGLTGSEIYSDWDKNDNDIYFDVVLWTDYIASDYSV